MPPEYVRWGESWQDHHPGWTMKLWTDDNVPLTAFPLLVKRSPSLAHRADIYRYEILAREGGIYVDCDFECKRSLEPIIDKLDAFSAVHDHEAWKAINNAFFGVTPGHPLMRDALRLLPSAAADTYSLGPPFFTRLAHAHKITLFPKKWFYPYPHQELWRRDEAFPDAYAVHHWGSQWTDSWARLNPTGRRG
jgi:mannosyltransferase OCH1-like enzyme